MREHADPDRVCAFAKIFHVSIPIYKNIVNIIGPIITMMRPDLVVADTFAVC